jgi:hypothetical protein
MIPNRWAMRRTGHDKTSVVSIASDTESKGVKGCGPILSQM